jgi:hypothetical protein
VRLKVADGVVAEGRKRRAAMSPAVSDWMPPGSEGAAGSHLTALNPILGSPASSTQAAGTVQSHGGTTQAVASLLPRQTTAQVETRNQGPMMRASGRSSA